MKIKKWTTANIPDLKGRVIIVTGGNSGLGFESVKAFAENGAEVVMACRSLEKGLKAKSEIEQNIPSAKIIIKRLNLMDLSSVIEFAKDINLTYDRIDVLLNNAAGNFIINLIYFFENFRIFFNVSFCKAHSVVFSKNFIFRLNKYTKFFQRKKVK